MCLLNVATAMDVGVAREWKPVCRGNSLRLEPGGTVALCGEDEVKWFGFLAAPVKVEVCVDRPPRRRSQLSRQVILQAVVDIQIEVESVRWESMRARPDGSAPRRRTIRVHGDNKRPSSRASDGHRK